MSERSPPAKGSIKDNIKDKFKHVIDDHPHHRAEECQGGGEGRHQDVLGSPHQVERWGQIAASWG